MVLFVFKVFVILFVVKVKGVDDFLRKQSFLYGIASLAEEGNGNSTCDNHLRELFEGINLKRFWALKVLDASGQPSSGFLWGNNLWLGSHSQCTDISNRKPFEINHSKVKHPPPSLFDFPPYPLEFGMAYMKHNSTQQLHTQMPLENLIELGLCIPKSCSKQMLQHYLQQYLDNRYLKAQQIYELSIKIEEIKILKEESLLSLPKTIVTLSICIITLLLVIVGTVYDVKAKKAKSKLNNEHKHHLSISTIGAPKCNGTNDTDKTRNNNKLENKMLARIPLRAFGEIARCFSIYSNTISLFKTNQMDIIGSVHGVRFLSLMWVICVHAVFYQIDYLDNVPTGFRLSEQFMVQILSNSTYCVDSFLFLSGFLISYSFYKSKKGLIACKKPVNVANKVLEFITMFVYRYLRLTPVYVITILLSDVLFTYYRQSTSLFASEKPDINCSKYWWRNILYINNFYPRSEMCLSWSWYLSADTQFFMVASILLILSTVMFRVATAILTFIIIICIIITGYSSYAVGYIPTMDEQFIYLDAIYDFPWNRIGPYLIGVITGYVLPYLTLMWIVFPAINLWILFTLYGRNITVEFSAVYMGISRTLWGFGLGWLLIACCTGNAGIIDKFLSFRGWIPLSRLTYCAYLLNPLLISIIFLGIESSQTSTLASFTLSIFGIAFITFFIAFFYSIFFESPYILLTKIMLVKLKRNEKNSSSNPA